MNKQQKKELREELEMLKNLWHPKLLLLIETFTTRRNELVIVSEDISKDLRTMLPSVHSLPTRVLILKDILDGMVWLANKGEYLFSFFSYQ